MKGICKWAGGLTVGLVLLIGLVAALGSAGAVQPGAQEEAVMEPPVQATWVAPTPTATEDPVLAQARGVLGACTAIGFALNDYSSGAITIEQALFDLETAQLMLEVVDPALAGLLGRGIEEIKNGKSGETFTKIGQACADAKEYVRAN